MAMVQILKHTALLLVILIITVSTMGFSHAADSGAETDDPHHPCQMRCLDATGSSCPDYPADEQSVPHECDSSCHCPCHAQLNAEPVQIGSSPPASHLYVFEPFQSLPEVYLSRFIPPHILA